MTQHDFKYLHNAEELAEKMRKKGLIAQIKQMKLARYPWRVYVYKES